MQWMGSEWFWECIYASILVKNAPIGGFFSEYQNKGKNQSFGQDS